MLNNLLSTSQGKAHQNDLSTNSVDPNVPASDLSKNGINHGDSGILKPLSDVSQDSHSKSQLHSRSQDDQRKLHTSDDNSLHFRDTFKQSAANSTSMSVTSKNITTASYLNQNNQFITSQPIPSQKSLGLNYQTNEYEQKTGIEELERRLNELESSASKANMTILQTMFSTTNPESNLETKQKHQNLDKRTPKTSPHKSQNQNQNLSEISVEKPVPENSDQNDASEQIQQSSSENNQRENKKKNKRQQKKRNNNNNNISEAKPTLEEEGEEGSYRETQKSEVESQANQNNTQTQEKIEHDVEITFDVLKQNSSDETNLVDQLQPSSASFNNQSLIQKERPQDNSEAEDSHQQSSASPDKRNYLAAPASPEKNSTKSSKKNSPVRIQNNTNDNTHINDENVSNVSASNANLARTQNTETAENYQSNQGIVPGVSSSSQKTRDLPQISHHDEEVDQQLEDQEEEREEESRGSLTQQSDKLHRGLVQRKKAPGKTGSENNSLNQGSIQETRNQSIEKNQQPAADLDHDSEDFQASHHQIPIQKKKKAQKASKKQQQQQKNHEEEVEEQSAYSQRDQHNESPLSYDRPSGNSETIYNPFYQPKPNSKKPNFNLDINQGQSQSQSHSQNQSQNQSQAGEKYFHPHHHNHQLQQQYQNQHHEILSQKHENSPAKNSRVYVGNNIPGSSQNADNNGQSLDSRDKEEISQVLSVYSKRENTHPRNDLNDSHNESSDRAGNQSHKFSQESANNFKHSFERLGKQETPTHFEISKNELSEVRLSRMSEEQAASLYEQRKNDIQRSIQKISKNKKKVVQSTPKNQNQTTPTHPAHPVQFAQAQGARDQPSSAVTKKKPSQESFGEHKEVPARQRNLKKTNPQPRTQLSPKPSHHLELEKEKEKEQQAGQREQRGQREQQGIQQGGQQGVQQREQQEIKQLGQQGGQQKNKTAGGELKLKATVKVNKNLKQNAQIPQAEQHHEDEQSHANAKYRDPIQVARESILQRMENIEKALVKTDESTERQIPTSSSAKKSEQPKSAGNAHVNKTTQKEKTLASPEPRYSSQSQSQSKQNVVKANNSYSAAKLNTPTNNQQMITDHGSEYNETVNLQTPSKQHNTSYSQMQRSAKLKQTVTSEYTQEDERKSRRTTTTTAAAAGGYQSKNEDTKVRVETLNLRSAVNKRNLNSTQPAGAQSHRQSTATATENNRVASQKDLQKGKGPKINYSEIPGGSKYDYNQSQQKLLEISTQEKPYLSRENSLSVKRSSGGFQQTKNTLSKNSQNFLNHKNKLQRGAVSASPDPIENNYERFYSRETSFDERNRLWVIKKNQNLAENERKQYLEEQSVCTFSPFSGRGSSLSTFDPGNFYQKNQEWVEKVKADNLTRAEVEVHKRHNPEARKPRQKVAPLTAIDAIRSQKLFVTRNLDALKEDLHTRNPSTNKKLTTYLEYDWDDGRLKEEIDEIEQLYGYVKNLVQKRLDPTACEATGSINQDSVNAGHPRGRASSYSYKHKSPNARASSLNNSIDNIRVQSLKKTFNKKEAVSSLNSVDREKARNHDDLETSVNSESNLRDLMKNKETKKLTIKDNHYVIINN